jgi:hypothetical protein
MRWSKQKSFKLMMAIADGEFVGSARRQWTFDISQHLFAADGYSSMMLPPLYSRRYNYYAGLFWCQPSLSHRHTNITHDAAMFATSRRRLIAPTWFIFDAANADRAL